ncbi:ribosomal RNA-processing protein 8 isoform 4-T4 [Liasis olivaceus]
MSSIAPRAPPRSAGCGCSAPPLPPRPPRRTRPPPGGNGGPGQDAAATSGRQGARAASPGPERCVTSGARVPARRARTMPAREALAAHSPAGSRGLSLGRPSPLPRQRLLDALRRRPGRGAPRGALRGPPGSEGRGGGGHNGARGAEAPEPSERPVPGEKRGGRRGPGEAAAEGSLGSGTRRGSAGGAAEELRQRLTRKQWRSRQKNKRRPKNKFKAIAGVGSREPSGSRPPASSAAEEPPDGRGGLVLDTEAPSGQTPSLRQRLESRLDAARFRYINQQLYTRSSQEAAQLFQEDPEALAVYHRGFALQAARWPERPVERFVRYLRRRPASLVVADFGCGDCTLARSLPNRVHCFDLAALDSRVTVCDMAQVPLEDASVDVAVFCLALMGTNLREILGEAHRVLRAGGTLLVAEVASRFADVRAFLGALARLGFRLVSKDVSGSHFYTFELRKAAAAAAAEEELRGLALRPCLYKRR